MKKLVLNTNSDEWKWRQLLIRLLGTGHSYIQFGFEWESLGTVYYGIIFVGTNIGEGLTVKVVISNRQMTFVRREFIDLYRLYSAEDFIMSLYPYIMESKDKLV